jgi:hypothetical protein
LTSWVKSKFVIACITVLLKGVLGVLSSTIFNWIMGELMKIPTGKFGVLGGWAVLWGPRYSLTETDCTREAYCFQRHREGAIPSPHANSFEKRYWSIRPSSRRLAFYMGLEVSLCPVAHW